MVALVSAVFSACHTSRPEPAIVRAQMPATRAETVLPLTPAKADSAPAPTRYTDIQFMQGMIAHHAQALEMTTLIPSRTSREDLRRLGERIDASQKAEIAMMQRWLRSHGAEVPSLDAHGMHHDAAGHMTMMPGMLTHVEMSQLEKSSGVEFERLFLQLMIRHHQGALTMVSDLMSTSGSARDEQIFNYATDINADQSAEIQRMQTLLRDIQ